MNWKVMLPGTGIDSFSDDLEEYLLVSTLISIYNILEGETGSS